MVARWASWALLSCEPAKGMSGRVPLSETVDIKGHVWNLGGPAAERLGYFALDLLHNGAAMVGWVGVGAASLCALAFRCLVRGAGW